MRDLDLYVSRRLSESGCGLYAVRAQDGEKVIAGTVADQFTNIGQVALWMLELVDRYGSRHVNLKEEGIQLVVDERSLLARIVRLYNDKESLRSQAERIPS